MSFNILNGTYMTELLQNVLTTLDKHLCYEFYTQKREVR